MIFKEYINQHIPVWAIIKQDHATTNNIDAYVKSEKLLSEPDFKNPFENGLRENILNIPLIVIGYGNVFLQKINHSIWLKLKSTIGKMQKQFSKTILHS